MMLGSQCSPCCGTDPCQSLKIRIKFSGLPNDCLDPYSQWYRLRDLDDLNGCSFYLFRQYELCSFITYLAGLGNNSADWGVRVVFAPEMGTLEISSGYTIITFGPAQGRTFGTLPYSGPLHHISTVVLQTAYSIAPTGAPHCSGDEWDDVSVVIDTGEADYLAASCPVGVGTSASCVPGEDTLPAVPGPHPPGFFGAYRDHDKTCDYCDENESPVLYYDSFFRPVWPTPELVVSVNFGAAQLSQPPGQNVNNMPQSIPGFASMSGTYSLKYSDFAGYVPEGGALSLNSDFSLAYTSVLSSAPEGSGPLTNKIFPLLGWHGTFYSTDYGEPDTGAGYQFVATDGVAVRTTAALQIAVSPLGRHVGYNYQTKQFTEAQCQGDSVAYQIRLKLFQTPNPDSGFGYYKFLGYWDPIFTYYASIPCQPRQCRGLPSFSVSDNSYSLNVRLSLNASTTVRGQMALSLVTV